MGNPIIYYKKLLQVFAASLYQDDMDKAKALLNESDIAKLELEIQEIKPKIPREYYYFVAGKSTHEVVADVMKNEGNDGLNACIGGYCEFADFIELEEPKN